MQAKTALFIGKDGPEGCFEGRQGKSREENKMAASSSGSGILGALSESNAVIALAIEVGDALVPIFKGAISEIKQIASGGETISYSVLIEGDQADLATVESMSDADLAAINSELARLGKPTLSVPPSSSESSGSSSAT
jgi:hypothetical protein